MAFCQRICKPRCPRGVKTDFVFPSFLLDLVMSSDDESYGSSGLGEQERVEKLRLANEALRKQLRDFSRLFESTLNNASAMKRIGPASSGQDDDDAKKSLRAIVNSKQKQVQNLKKKLDMYRRSNQQLKTQMKHAFTTDRVAQLTNENHEKQMEIEKLMEENRNLVAMQRSHAKKLAKQSHNREEWPAKLSNLQDELRVTREMLRKYKEKSRNLDEEATKQRELMNKLKDKNKDLSTTLKELESKNGKIRPREVQDVAAQQEAWNEERMKLERAIQVLEKSNKQERIKAHQAAKEIEAKIKEHESAMAKMKSKFDVKEKDMRFQVVEVKKLKRGLRELAMSEGALASGSVPWSSNLASFFNDEDAHLEDEMEEIEIGNSESEQAEHEEQEDQNQRVEEENPTQGSPPETTIKQKEEEKKQEEEQKEPERPRPKSVFAKPTIKRGGSKKKKKF